MNTSKWYPSKEVVAKAIHQWAGDDWPNRVITKQQSIVNLQTEGGPVALEEAQVSCAIRAFRSAIVKWWHNEVVRADAEGMALSIVEDDLLVKELWAQACTEEDFQDCLEQGLKCETDTWEGHVIWLGPRAVEQFLRPYSKTPPYSFLMT